MTQATETISPGGERHLRVVGAVSAAHFVSHYYIIILAPLLPFVRAEYGVSYTEIGLALTAFNLVTAALQLPAGFLVDRLGARILLIGGLLIGGSAFIAVGLVHSFWVMVAMFALAGVGNTVYHPADYALLSQHVPARSIGHAFSMHTFAGMVGSAAAPVTLLAMQAVWGWRGAFIGAGCLGIAVAGLLLAIRDRGHAAPAPAPAAQPAAAESAWHLLLSGPILLNLLFFTLLAMISGGTYNYSVVALGALHGTPVTAANAALTGNLALTAIGVILGGFLVGRTSRHALVAGLGLVAIAGFTLLPGQFDLGNVGVIAALSAAGFAAGVIMPSRDMIVRAVTPPGSFGKVFGFVTTGFNIGGIVSPLVFGAVMDHGSPYWVFALIAAFSLLAILTVLGRARPAA